MKNIIVLIIAALFVFCSNCFADETVDSHLFDDLNGNGVSDLNETPPADTGEEASSSSARGGEVEDIELPPTPEE